MPAPELYTHFLERLNATGIRYMITGGLAAIIYGEPRLTNDVDIVIVMGAEDVEVLVTAFPAPDYYAPPAEVVRQEMARPAWGHVNLLHVETALRADIYPLGDDELGGWAMGRRWAAPMAGETVWVAPIEYVMLKKLAYFRDGDSQPERQACLTGGRISWLVLGLPTGLLRQLHAKRLAHCDRTPLAPLLPHGGGSSPLLRYADPN